MASINVDIQFYFFIHPNPIIQLKRLNKFEIEYFDKLSYWDFYISGYYGDEQGNAFNVDALWFSDLKSLENGIAHAIIECWQDNNNVLDNHSISYFLNKNNNCLYYVDNSNGVIHMKFNELKLINA